MYIVCDLFVNIEKKIKIKNYIYSLCLVFYRKTPGKSGNIFQFGSQICRVFPVKHHANPFKFFLYKFICRVPTSEDTRQRMLSKK